MKLLATDWQRVIDHKLIEWGWNTREFDEEGVEPPSREIVRLAIDLAERFRDAGFPAPDSVVPDPNGGIVFERRENGLTEVFQRLGRWHCRVPTVPGDATRVP